MRSRRTITLHLWMIAVAGALTFQPAIARIFLLVIFALLCTTPADAIRLPRFFSEVFIMSATAMLRWPHDVPSRVHLSILVLMLALLRLWNKSPWWAVLYGWFPL